VLTVAVFRRVELKTVTGTGFPCGLKRWGYRIDLVSWEAGHAKHVPLERMCFEKCMQWTYEIRRRQTGRNDRVRGSGKKRRAVPD
jgi:hypothetical protein